MLEYIKSSNRHAESHEKGPDVVKKLKNMQVYPLRPGRFQRHRPMGGDCKIRANHINAGLDLVSAPSPHGRGLQEFIIDRPRAGVLCFTATSPWGGTARSSGPTHPLS